MRNANPTGRLGTLLVAALPFLLACADDPLGPDEDLLGVTVSVAGIGASGVITSQPAGITCRLVDGVETGTCGAGFRPGTRVTLTAQPAGPDMAVLQWGDDCAATTTLSCTLTVSEPRSVTITFGRMRVQELVFRSAQGGISELWVQRAHTGATERLLAPGISAFDPAISFDGALAFMRTTTEGQQQLWLGQANGTGLRRWTTADANERMPTFSPDGRRIAFVSTRGGTLGEIWVAGVDGRGLVNLTPSPVGTAIANRTPAWSPQGDRIAFSSNRQGYFTIWVVPAAGGPVTQVTNSAASDLWPTWSPDGSKLCFVRQFADGSVDLVIRTLATGAEQRIALPGREGHPAWSFDGSRIAFDSDRDGDTEIFTMAPDGTAVTQLTHNTVDDTAPAWLRR